MDKVVAIATVFFIVLGCSNERTSSSSASQETDELSPLEFPVQAHTEFQAPLLPLQLPPEFQVPLMFNTDLTENISDVGNSNSDSSGFPYLLRNGKQRSGKPVSKRPVTLRPAGQSNDDGYF